LEGVDSDVRERYFYSRNWHSGADS
jgi:hypothetical protein